MSARDGFRRAAQFAARSARPALPLGVRKRIVAAAARRGVPGQVTLGVELLRDMARDDPAGFHHFLWANHLAYAARYRLGCFAPEALEADRRLLFELLSAELGRQGSDPATVRSMLDAGCSLGYLLRYAETDVFLAATTLMGFDIDVRAVAAGNSHLRAVGSRVELRVGGLEQLDELVPGHRFDVVICCGVLMYLDEVRAARAVAGLLDHTERMVGLIDRAHPERDNASLSRSAVRPVDETWIHDLDGMVERAGGRIVARRWQPPGQAGDRGVYLLVAVPGRRAGDAPRGDGRPR